MVSINQNAFTPTINAPTVAETATSTASGAVLGAPSATANVPTSGTKNTITTEAIAPKTTNASNSSEDDVAEYMNYSKPSVCRAVGLLKNGGYITMDKDGSLSLTDSGKETANKIFERHTILSKLLEKIGVEKDVAAKEACKIEHVISDDTLNKIKDFLEK